MYQERYDIHDPVGQCSLVLPLLMKRAKVIEIVVVHDIVFALASSGVCAAFSRGDDADVLSSSQQFIVLLKNYVYGETNLKFFLDWHSKCRYEQEDMFLEYISR